MAIRFSIIGLAWLGLACGSTLPSSDVSASASADAPRAIVDGETGEPPAHAAPELPETVTPQPVENTAWVQNPEPTPAAILDGESNQPPASPAPQPAAPTPPTSESPQPSDDDVAETLPTTPEPETQPEPETSRLAFLRGQVGEPTWSEDGEGWVVMLPVAVPSDTSEAAWLRATLTLLIHHTEFLSGSTPRPMRIVVASVYTNDRVRYTSAETVDIDLFHAGLLSSDVFLERVAYGESDGLSQAPSTQVARSDTRDSQP